MTKTLLTADWHLTDNPRDAYRHEWQKELLRIAKKYQVDEAYILGDLCEQKDHHSAWLVNAVVGYICALAKICRVLVLRGNHDYNNPDSPFWAFLHRIPNVGWVNGVLPLSDRILLPHTHNHEYEWEGINFDEYDYVFAHNTFSGAVSESGFKLKGIPADVFGNATVFSGDIHVPQDEPVIYVGAPYTIDFGDNYEPRVIILDTDAGEWFEVPCKGRQKILLEATYHDGKLELNSEQEDLVFAGDIVKVRVELLREHHAEWPALQQRIRKWGAGKGLEIYQVVPSIIETKQKQQGKKRQVNRRSDDELLVEYARNKGLGKTAVKIGREILNAT